MTPSYDDLVENAPTGVFHVAMNSDQLDESTADPKALYVNEALADLLSFDSPEQLYSKVSSIEHADPSKEEAFREQLLEIGHVESFETTLIGNDGEPIEVLLSGTLEDGELTGYVTDIGDRKRLERKAKEQAEAILEQSTPIVQIWDGITLATVVGTLDTTRAQRLTEELLAELTENDSDIALIDITGVPTVDTATAQYLIDTVNAVSLLGSKVIITGINPEIAQTLVHLGITLDEVRTKSSLSEGLKLGLHLIRDDINPVAESQ